MALFTMNIFVKFEDVKIEVLYGFSGLLQRKI